jgi:hypothetical protein
VAGSCSEMQLFYISLQGRSTPTPTTYAVSSDTTLKNNLDILMPNMQTVCAAATGLRCHWVDLRPVWVDGDTADGFHPTQSGGDHCGDAIWQKMVEECIAQ